MKHISFWDRIGIGVSGLCAVHCLFFPVTLALLPLWPVAEVVHLWTHPILFVLIVPTVIFAVRNTDFVTNVSYPLYSGLVLVGFAWLLHDWVGSWGEALITLAGSLLLIAGHWNNYKYHQLKLQCQHEAS